jgi:hypothetical protein
MEPYFRLAGRGELFGFVVTAAASWPSFSGSSIADRSLDWDAIKLAGAAVITPL